jgi:hypothetical protein
MIRHETTATARKRSLMLALLSPLTAWRERRRAREAAEDAEDVAEALRILGDPNEQSIPIEQVKRELGL